MQEVFTMSSLHQPTETENPIIRLAREQRLRDLKQAEAPEPARVEAFRDIIGEEMMQALGNLGLTVSQSHCPEEGIHAVHIKPSGTKPLKIHTFLEIYVSPDGHRFKIAKKGNFKLFSLENFCTVVVDYFRLDE